MGRRDWNVQADVVPLLNDLMPLVQKGGVVLFLQQFPPIQVRTVAGSGQRSPRNLPADGTPGTFEIGVSTAAGESSGSPLRSDGRQGLMWERQAIKAWEGGPRQSKPLNKSMVMEYISGLVVLYQASTTYPIR